MTTPYAQLIKTLRTERGISQLDAAERLGMSRTSYIAVEQGKRELTLSEAQKIADLLGITTKELEGGFSANYEKYKQMILAYLRSSVSNDKKVPKTKLAKLVYLADFAWFYETFSSMSGMSYRRNHFGPVPDAYFRALDELESEGRITIDHKEDTMLISENQGPGKEQLTMINNKELALIEEIAKKWKGKPTREIVDFTHKQLPYSLCKPDEIIPYELITQEDPDHVY